MTGFDLDGIMTVRLLVRAPRESDRSQLVDFFCNQDFMKYSGVLTAHKAQERFDHMVAVARPSHLANSRLSSCPLGLWWDIPASTTSTLRTKHGWSGDTG